MKFDVIVTTILVFFVPGAIVLFGAPISFGEAVDALRSGAVWHATTTTVGAFFTIFVLGAFIDSLRAHFVQPFIKMWAENGKGAVGVPSGYLKDVVKDAKGEAYEAVCHRAFQYYRLNANILTALLLVCGLFLLGTAATALQVPAFSVPDKSADFNNSALAVAGLVAWIPISIRSLRQSNSALSETVNATAAKAAG